MWFVAVVSPNTEIACQQKLERLFVNDRETGLETYVPVQRELHEWPSTGKRKWIDWKICPCYLFIRCSEKFRYTIACKAKFILHFVMDRSRCNPYGKADFARIPDDQMQEFRRMVGDAETPVTIDTTRLQVGSKVRVKSGQLAGMVGFLVREPKGDTRLAIRINMLGYASVDVPAEYLESVE